MLSRLRCFTLPGRALPDNVSIELVLALLKNLLVVPDHRPNALSVASTQQHTQRTHMLTALLWQRTGSVEAARAAFRDGSLAWDPNASSSAEDARAHAQLLQAWGLFEQRQGNAGVALALVRDAVRVDGSLSRILNWKMFRGDDSAAPKGLRADFVDYSDDLLC